MFRAVGQNSLKAMLHPAIFLATCNATMTNKKPLKLQRGCYTQAAYLATLRKVEGRSTFSATRNATIAVVKWGVTREFFLATCNVTFVALQVARQIASCNMTLTHKGEQNALSTQGDNNMNFRLARDQLVPLETAANL